MPESLLPVSHCPSCNYEMDQATSIHGKGAVPDPGSVSICLNCGQIMVFAEDLSLKKPTAVEIKDIMRDDSAWRTIEKAQRIIH